MVKRLQFIDYLSEIFDTKVSLYDVPSHFDFGKGFTIGPNKYRFEAKIEGTAAVVGFDTNGDPFHKMLHNTDATKVFGGVFTCIGELLDTYKIDALVFNTDVVRPEPRDPNNPSKGYKMTLVDFYDGKNFQRYLHSKFGFKLKDQNVPSNIGALAR
jgi:hypothetical protein